MPKGSSISLFTLIGVLCAFLTGAPALDETKYPDWTNLGPVPNAVRRVYAEAQ